MANFTDLERAANALRELEQYEHAENVHEYVSDKTGKAADVLSTLRLFVYWALVISTLLIGFGGALDFALSGKYFSAIGILMVVVLMFTLLWLLEKMTVALHEHAEEQIQEIRVENQR